VKIDIVRIFFRFYLKNKAMPHGEIDMGKVNNILIMSNAAIGDTLFATPAIKLIKKYYPDKNVVALLSPKNYKLFETNPNIDKVITYSGKWRDFLIAMIKLKKCNIDVTLIMNSNEPQASPLSYCIGSKYIVRVPNNNNEFNHLHLNSPISRNYEKHTIHTRLKQLEYVGIKDKSLQMELFPNSDWYKPVRKVLDRQYRYIGIQVGASTISRMWFNEKWVALVNKILKYDKDIRIVLTGSPQERHLTDALEKSISNKRVLNFAGKFDLCGAAALIGSLDLLVTPDTGPLHIAAAMGRPTVAISVASSALSTNPIDSLVPHVYIQKPKTCSPCINRKCRDQKCMLQISADEVFDSVIALL